MRYYHAGRFYELALRRWGDPDLPVIFCAHGLARSGADFAALAERLSGRFHLVAPDYPGQGASAWWAEAAAYGHRAYAEAFAQVLAAIGRDVVWLGTSQGGITGMVMAGLAGAPLRGLILNDIGSFLPAAGLRALSPGAPPARFVDWGAAERFFRARLAGFGAAPEQFVSEAIRATLRETDGGVVPRQDPAVTASLAGFAEAEDQDLRRVFARVRVPVLVIRGAASTLLTEATVAEMRAAGAESHTVPGAGHAPWLTDEDSARVIGRFCAALVPGGARPM